VKIDHRIRVDVTKPLVSEGRLGHNRWHPAIEPIARVAPGETVAVDLRDGMDVQITPESTTRSLLDYSGYRGNPMTGPLFIERAEPGDLLDVEILKIETGRFGFTSIIPGIGLLSDRYQEPFLVQWQIEKNLARSNDLPGVVIQRRPSLGVMGVAPSEKRLREFASREDELSRRGYVIRTPNPKDAVPSVDPVPGEGLRPIPPRETGGNMDIRQLGEGSVLTLPVDVHGALFSAGDPHFAQGDGESCGVAIETSATAYLRFGVRKSTDLNWRPRYPMFQFSESPNVTVPRRYIATTGIPINSRGQNEYLDLNTAARAAVEEMIAYLTNIRGFTEEQAYVLVSVAADLRVSQVVDFPNAIVSVVLPLAIFE